MSLTRRGIVARRTLVLVAAIVLLGWLNAQVPTETEGRHLPQPGPTCYEDGACDDGYCQPGALCDDSLDGR